LYEISHSQTLKTTPIAAPPGPAVPVIALGGGVTLIGVLRILGRAEIPTFAVCPKSDLATLSRWYRALPGKVASVHASALPVLLESLSVERAVLLPCADDWALAVADLPPTLATKFAASTAPPGVLAVFTDKWRFAQALEREGIPHPHTRLVNSRGELADLREAELQATFLKPVSSVEFSRRHGVKGYLIASREEALRMANRIEFPVMIQEFIPGPPTAGYFLDGFVDRDGRICARFARQRLRMHPPRLGNSSLMVSVPLEAVSPAAAALDRLLKTLKYQGIFSAEFKHDQRDGQFKLLEVNARPWWYVEFAARCGVDVCRMAYRDALGLPVEPVAQYEVGQRCVFYVQDLYAWRDQPRADRISLGSWLRPWLGAGSALFSWSDPVPGLAYLWQRVQDRVRRKGPGKRDG
jgi:predicted ATP-grasp superfamily ATP-dependent carboligase